MQRTGTLRTGVWGLGAALLALLLVPQANAAVSVGKRPTAESAVQHVTFDRLHKKHRHKHHKHRHYKHKKYKKHHHHH
jgi:hypothetical protein